MIIDRSKHNKFVANSTYTDLINRTQSSGKDSTTSSTSGNIIYVGGGGESGNIDSDLIEELRNQEAFSYLNVSDGTNTEKVEAKIEKDYMNLNFVGDSESTETKVSSGRYLPETYFEATGTKSGNYNLSYEQISVPEIVDEKPVEIIKWRIVLKKVFGNSIFPSIDFTGIELLKEDISLGVYDLDDKRVTVSSDDTTGLSQIIILQDKDLDFDKLQLVKQVGAKNEVVTTISNISIQTYITVLITQAGAARFWKLDEHNKLYTDYDAYSNKTLGAKDMIWSNKGYKVGNFVQGISGGVFYISDKLGTTYIEADKLRVRKKAYFETLEIVNVNTVGGKQIISPGGAVTIRKVEEFDDYYRCYFLGKQDDVVVENRFRVNDLAFSQNFNIKEPGEYEQVANHYFWRLVVGVSTNVDANDNHYIDLSKTDCDLNSDIPHVNDVIAQLGNRTDTDRQSALIFSSVDVESPRIILCSGISTYTLTATDRFDLGVNHTNNQAYMNVYGNAYIGAKDQSSYMSYSVENGLSIKGNLDISSTIGDKSFSDVFVTSENFEETVNAVIGDELEYLQNQIDGNIESYFYDYSPTLENYPASEWADEQIKTRHIGDTFTNIQEYVDDETTPDAGKSWRWVKSAEGVWGWTPIADSDAVLALKKAGQAQDTADGKRRVFVQQPTDMDVYDVGDLWVNATYSDSNVTYTDDLLRAKTSKAKGHPFNIKHWTLASNYKNLAEDAIAAAEEAGEAANNAQQSINNYKNEINSVFQDGIITTSEASRLRTLVDTINTTLVDAQKTYEEVYNNGALDNKSQKTELASAFSAFDTAADNLIQIVTEIVNKATTQSYTITKADISNVDNAYSIFNTKYADYIIALNAANLEIMNTLSNNAYANAVNAFGWLNGLFDPDQKTTIEGAVVTTGVLALGKTTDGVFTVNAGINGVENNSYLGNGIAIWFGGDMIDKDNYSAGQRPENTASSLFRFDGSGYLGYKPNSDASRDDAPIWWDTQGNLHANPLSFFVGETTVGFLLSAFQPVDSNEDGDADYLIQHIPFQTLQIGSAYLGYDAVNKAVYVYTLEDDGSTNVCNFYATGEVTAYGSSDGSSMPTVINYLYELRDVNWGIGTKPSNADTMIMWNGETWLYVNKNEVGLNEEQLEQYLTENGYAKKSDITNDVNAVSVTGSGNAVTSASISGHTLTLTKGSTFLLSSAYTAADILTKLKTVDGSNSGLDADTVDGKHLADILASNVASATKLQTARSIWGQMFDGTANVKGNMTGVGSITATGAISTTSYIQIGKGRIYWDETNKALYVKYNDGNSAINFYSLGEITAYGSSSSSGGGSGVNYDRLDDWSEYTSDKAGYVLSAKLGWDLNTRIEELEAGSALNITTTGTGNAVTSITKNNNTLTVNKGNTFLLASQYTATDILNKLKTVDGSNSGLDADTLDGKHYTDIINGNVYSATKLQTARLIWGRSFDGTNDISGDIKNVGNIYGTGRIYINSHGNIVLRYNNDDTKSIALTATSFKPFGTATNKIDLGNSTDRWRNLYIGSNADITGNTIIGGKLSVTGLITASAGLTTTNYIQIGNGRIYWDQKNKALYVKSSDGTSAINFYSTGEVAAYGSNSESGGGSTSYDRLDDWNDYSEDKSGYVLSAGLGWDLNSRIKDIESNGILNINTTGSGNVVTNISKSGTVITVTKGITALTSVNLATITDLHSTWDSVLKNAKPTTLSGYGIQASDVLNTIKTVDGHNSGLNADLLDGWHRSEFYTPFDGSKTYGGSFSAGAQDTGWKKLCDVIIPETGTHKGVIIDGNISYSRTNHAAAVFIKTPFQIVFFVDGTNTTRHRVYLYIPKYFTYDVIQVVKLDEYNYQVQIRQFSSYHTVYAFFQTKTYGGTRTVPYNKIETASDGEVICNIANASVMVEDSAYTATKLQTPRKIWGQNFDGTKDISGDLKNVGNIYGTNKISLISNTGNISFKFNNDEASSIAFTRTEFRPYANSNNKINLGRSDIRWKDLYLGGNAHIDGNITANSLILPYSRGNWLSMATGSGVLRGASGNSSDNVAHALYRVKDKDGNVLAFGGYQSSLGFYGFLASDIETSNNKFTFYTAWNINTKILTHRGNLVVTEKVGIGSSTISEMLNINGNIKFLGTSFYLKDYHGNSVLKYTDGHFTLASNDSPIYIRTKGIDDNTNQVSISNTDGLVTLTSLYSKNYIQIGDGRIYWDAANKALYIKHRDGTSAINFYSTGEITAYGKSGQSGGGGTNYDRLDSWEDYTSDKSGYVLSAGLGWDLNTRVNKLEQGSALTITTTGNGNAVTAITKNGTVITVTKDKTFLDATNYASTLDTRYVKKSGDTMSGSLTIYGILTQRSSSTNNGVALRSNSTGGCLQLGNVADSKQIQNGYITGYLGSNLNSLKIRTVNNSAVTINDNKVWNAGNDGHNSGLDADLLDGTHKTGLLTALSSSSTTNISLTVGGTTKTISDLYATTAEKLSTTSAGSATRPVYFANGIPVAGTYTFGNANGNAAINNGTLNANLNADKLDGYHYTAFPLRNTTNLYVNSTNPSVKILEFERTSEKGWLRLSISDSNNGSHGVTAKYIVSWSYDNSNENKSVTLRCLYYFVKDVSTKLTVSRISGKVFGLYYTPNSVASYVQYLIEGHSTSCVIRNYNSSTTATPTATYTSSLQQIGLIAAQATKLQTPITLWGQSFDGTANVSGNLSGVGSIIFSNDGYIRNAETYIGFYTVDGKAKGIKAKTLYLGTTYANEPSYTLHVGGTLGVDSTARIGGALTSVGLITASAGLTTSQYIQIGDGRIYWDATNKALYVKHKDGSTAINFYATGEITAYGSSSSSGGGGGTSYDRLDSWDDYESGKAGYVLSAGLGWDLNTRVKSLEGGSALTVTTTGTGNVITSISKSGTTITANKGITALTSVNIATISDLNSGWDSLLKAAPSIYVTRHPSISEVTNKQNLVIKLNNGTTEGTNLFTYNVTSAKTINITASSIGAAASSHNHSWSNITSGKPTTLSGYGITDAYTKNASDSRYVNVSGDTMTGMLKVSSGGITSTTSTNNGVRLTGDSRGGWVQFGTMDMDPTNKVGVISAYAGVDLTSLDVRIANNGFTINSNPILHTGNYTSTLDGRYVKKSGDTMTGPLKINGTTDQLIVIDSNRTPYIEFKLNGSRQAVFGGSNNVPSVYTNTWHKIWHAGNDGPESGLNADLLDDYHYNEFESYKKVVIDASALNENTWYPVTMLIGNSLQTRIRIEGNTSAEASWNSRSDKMMSLILDYTVNGCYWGWTNVNRVIYQYIEGQGTSSCLRGLGQLTNSSTEYVFVRGGAVYNFYVSRFIEPVLRSSTYTVSGQSVSPTTTMPDAITINNALITSNVASATKLKNPRNIWGQSFDGTNNVSGSMTSVTAINDNIYFNNLKTIIVTSVITASQDSQWRSRSVCIANSNTVAYGMNIWSNGDGTGHIQVGRTAGTVTYYDFILQEYGGNVGIGTKSPSQKLHVNGNILATGEVTAYSDQRLKSNIEPLVYRGRLNPKSYIKDNKQSIGFIAQDVQELYPELVMETGGDNNYLSLNYGNITAVLSAQINTVEDEVTILKRRVKELEDKLEVYESSITTSI